MQHTMQEWAKHNDEVVLKHPTKDLDPGEHKFIIQRPEGNREYYIWVPKVRHILLNHAQT